MAIHGDTKKLSLPCRKVACPWPRALLAGLALASLAAFFASRVRPNPAPLRPEAFALVRRYPLSRASWETWLDGILARWERSGETAARGPDFETLRRVETSARELGFWRKRVRRFRRLYCRIARRIPAFPGGEAKRRDAVDALSRALALEFRSADAQWMWQVAIDSEAWNVAAKVDCLNYRATGRVCAAPGDASRLLLMVGRCLVEAGAEEEGAALLVESLADRATAADAAFRLGRLVEDEDPRAARRLFRQAAGSSNHLGARLALARDPRRGIRLRGPEVEEGLALRSVAVWPVDGRRPTPASIDAFSHRRLLQPGGRYLVEISFENTRGVATRLPTALLLKTPKRRWRTPVRLFGGTFEPVGGRIVGSRRIARCWGRRPGGSAPTVPDRAVRRGR